MLDADGPLLASQVAWTSVSAHFSDQHSSLTSFPSQLLFSAPPTSDLALKVSTVKSTSKDESYLCTLDPHP